MRDPYVSEDGGSCLMTAFVVRLICCKVLVLIPSAAKPEWLPQERRESRPKKRKKSVEVVDLE